MFATIYILVCTLLSIGLQGINQWFLSKGDLSKSYPLTIAVYVVCICMETFLALRDPSQWGILFFLPLYVWTIALAIKGMLRLKKEKKERENK